MQDPQRAASVFKYMAEHRKQLPTWMNGNISTEDFQMTEDDRRTGRVMMVDVGGGAGHQCLALRETFPHLKGKMVVQDMVSIRRQLSVESGVEIQLTETHRPS